MTGRGAPVGLGWRRSPRTSPAASPQRRKVSARDCRGTPMPDLHAVRPRPIRRTGVNVAASLTGQLVGKASTLAWTLVAARELTRSGYGLFFYAYALAGLASAVAEWGVDPVFIERVSRDPDRVDVNYTSAQAARTFIAVPAFT